MYIENFRINAIWSKKIGKVVAIILNNVMWWVLDSVIWNEGINGSNQLYLPKLHI